MAVAKASKGDADYTRQGMPASHCGICLYFTAPDKCYKVEGPVSRTGWCKFFHRREKAHRQRS